MEETDIIRDEIYHQDEGVRSRSDLRPPVPVRLRFSFTLLALYH